MTAAADEAPIRFRSGSVDLGGRISAPPGASQGCVVCHPHPLYGGDMTSSVVVAITRELGRAGIATLRFDFRGAGTSGGEHEGGKAEVGDARAAVGALCDATGLARIAIAGYSFGAFIAWSLAASDPRIAAVVAVAPPIAMPGFALTELPDVPFLLIGGDRDAYCPAQKMTAIAAGANRAKTVVVAGADHFFAGHEVEIGSATRDFVEGL
jgi:alpha/beta superfamily hydrolase